jgi:hypothetical protein
METSAKTADNINQLFEVLLTIVIRPDPGVDLAKKPGPGLYGFTQVNPERFKKNI